MFAACRRPNDEIATDGVEPLILDVADPASIRRFNAQLEERTDRLDLLVHNAGIPNAGPWEASEGFGTLELEAMEKVIRTNCLGPLLLTQACVGLLEKADRPIVAGISSLFSSFAWRDAFFANNFAYSMSKVSLNMWLRSLAILRPEILTLALDPGWVRTDMGGPEAPLAPTEVIEGCLRVLDGLTKERSGEYVAWDGSLVPW